MQRKENEVEQHLCKELNTPLPFCRELEKHGLLGELIVIAALASEVQSETLLIALSRA